MGVILRIALLASNAIPEFAKPEYLIQNYSEMKYHTFVKMEIQGSIIGEQLMKKYETFTQEFYKVGAA